MRGTSINMNLRALLLIFYYGALIAAAPLIDTTIQARAPALSCPVSHLTVYTTPSGTAYIVECGFDHGGADLGWDYFSSFADCLTACSTTPNCSDVTWLSDIGFCYKKNGPGSVSSATASVWSAHLAPKLPTAALTCPESHGQLYTVNSENFMVECYTNREGADLGPVSAHSLNDCIASCAGNSACVAATFVQDTEWCWLKNFRGVPSLADVMGLRLIDAGACLPNPTPYSGPQWNGFKGVEYWFAFGDSYSEDGFDMQGLQPSGVSIIDNHIKRTPQWLTFRQANPIGNPGPPFQTTAIGANYLVFLAEHYNLSTVLVYDLAQSGAILPDPSILGLGSQWTHVGSQQVQYDWLENYASTLAVPWTAHNSMFSFWFGINDCVDFVGLNSTVSIAYMDADLAAYSAQLKFVYAQGARNFLVINVPPTDRTPGWNLRSDADRQNLAQLIAPWNTALANMVNMMRQSHPDATVFLYDAWTTFSDVITDPTSRQGTSNLSTTATWCDQYIDTDDPYACNSDCKYGCVEQYMWQDYIHPTWVIHEVLASEIVTLLG